MSPRQKLQLVVLIASALSAACSETTSSIDLVVTSLPAATTAAGYVCPPPIVPAAIGPRTLVLLVRTGHVAPEIEECFERIYGVEVERREFSSYDRLPDTLAAEPATFDLIELTDYAIAGLVFDGRLQKLDKRRLELIDNFYPDYLNFAFDPDNAYTIPFRAGTYGLIANTALVPRSPQSWADLWGPEYTGGMVFPEDSRAVIGAALLSLGYDPNTTDRLQLEVARRRLAELVTRIRVFDSDSPKTALIAGDVQLGMTWAGEAEMARAENPALQYVYPAEGAILWQESWAIPADAPHEDLAYAWLNYVSQGDVSSQFLLHAPFTSPNRVALEYLQVDHPDAYDLYMNSPITNTAVEILVTGHRLTDVGESRALYEQIWREVTGLE